MHDTRALFSSLNGSELKIAIVVARWNSECTFSLRDGVVAGLKDSGVQENNIVIQEVPGTYEVVYGAKQLIEKQAVDAIVCLGVLVKGETMHFEYISEAVSTGIMHLSLSSNVPIIYGILNCLSEQQARLRSIGEKNHGPDWGRTAVEMALLKKN